MATTTKVIVQIHERTTYAQLTTDLQLRELGYESTNDSFNFNNNAGVNFTIWAKESTGVIYDNAVTIASGDLTLSSGNLISIKSGAISTITDSDTHSSGVNGGGVTLRGKDSGGTQRPLAGIRGLSKGSQNGQLALYTGNLGSLVERVRIDEDGKLGVGIVNPDGTLHIHTATAGSVTANTGADDLTVENSTHGGISILGPNASEQNIYFGSPSDAVGAIARWVYDDNVFRVGSANVGASTILTSGSFVDAVTIDSTGKVGIGTTSPGNALEVNGATDNVIAKLVSTDTHAYISFEDSTTTTDTVQIGATGDEMRLITSGATRVTILSDGNVGIGEASPDYTLEINSGNENIVAKFVSTDANAQIVLEDSTTTTNSVQFGVQGDNMRLITGSTARVEINSTGDVEIISGDLSVTAGTLNVTETDTSPYSPTVYNVIATLRNSQSLVDDAVAGISLAVDRTSGDIGVVNLLCVPSGAGSGDFIVQSRNSSVYQENLRVTAGGNVTVTVGDLALSTVGKKVTVATTGGTGEFYGSGGNTVLNTTTDNILLAVEGTTKVTVGTDVTIASAVALITTASASGKSGFRLPHGTAPSAPANGDLWTTTTGVFARVNGGTYQMPVVTAGAATMDLDQAASATDTTWYWTKSDDQVTITPQSNASATSTATTNFTLSGLPANLRPTTVGVTVYIHVFNDTAKEFAKMEIGTTGTVTISRWDGSDFSATNFTTSSLRGLYSMPAFTYKIL